MTPAVAFRNNKQDSISQQAVGTCIESASTSRRMSSSSSLSSMNPWCCTAASILQDGINVKIDKNPVNHSTIFDLSQFSCWVEWMEQIEDRVEDEGGAGAYDVFRCDLLLSNCPSNNSNNNLNDVNDVVSSKRWKLWGEEFHLKRLYNSYLTLMKEKQRRVNDDERSKNNIKNGEKDDMMKVSKDNLDLAYKQSKSIIKALLKEAESSPQLNTKPPDTNEGNGDGAESKASEKDNDTLIQLVKMSLLWSPEIMSDSGSSSSSSNRIVVRGHACSSCKPTSLRRPHDPIVATVAVSLHANQEVDNDGLLLNMNDDGSVILPNRTRCPQAKVASWCRLRKPLEDPETYKPQGVGEVLMLRPTINSTKYDGDDKNDMELLEGLTSNVFVVYKDGTIRTAQEGVLHGYARHLVLKCVERCGMTFDRRPILLSDGAKGLWKEAFITSSSRLIYPISHILVPHDDNDATDNDVDADDINRKKKKKNSEFDLKNGNDGTALGFENDGHVRFTEFWHDPCLINQKEVDQVVDGSSHNKEQSQQQWKILRNAMFDDTLDE